MNKKKKIYQVLLLLFAFIVVFLLGGLIVLKIKDDKKDTPKGNNGGNPVKETSNYIEEFDIETMLKKYKEISFNSNTTIEDIKLYGLESLEINKISIENGKIKYYSNDKEYTSNNLSNVKYIEYASDNKTYSEILVYASNGVYYFNTNGNAEIVDEEAYSEYFKDNKEKAFYSLEDNVLNLSYTKVSNSNIINGISTIKEEEKSYFVVKTSSNTYVLDYETSTKHGIKVISTISIGDKISEYVSSIGEIGKDKKLKVNYDLSLTNKEKLKYDDKILYPEKVYLTKEAYYFVYNEDIYILKLSNFDNDEVEKYNKKEVEKISLDEEKTYQGDVITSVNQYLKILYKDGSSEEIH